MKYLIIYSVCIFLSFSRISFGQTQKKDLFFQDSIQAIEYFNIADTSYNNVDTCMHYSYLAIPLLQKTKQFEKYLYCLAGLSYCYNVKENYDSLESNNIRAYEMAKGYLEPDHFLFIPITNNLGKVYEEIRQDYEQAIALYTNALESIDSTNIHYAVKGTLLRNIGEVYLKKGDFNRSIVYLNEALQQFEIAYESYVYENTKTYFKIIEIYESLARVYQFQGNHQLREKYLMRILTLLESNTDELSEKYFIDSYLPLADVLLEQQKYANAIIFLDKTSNLKSLTAQQHIVINQLYSKFFLLNNEFNKAIKYINKAAQFASSSQPITQSKTLNIKGKIFFQQQKYAKAIAAYHEGIQYLVPNDSFSIDSPKLESRIKILSRLDLIEQLQAIGKTLNIYYLEKKEKKLLEQSLNCFLLISQLSDQLREDYQSDESKLFLNNTTHPFYEEGIATAYQLFEITQDRIYLNDAFYFFEKSKSVVLLDELKAKEAAGIFTIPPEIAEKQYQLRADINYLKRKIERVKQNDKDDNPDTRSWNSEIFELTQQQAQLKEQIKEAYPDYVAFTKGAIPSIFDIQKELTTPYSALVEYFVGESNSYVFFITQESIKLRKIANNKTINSWVKELTENMKLNQQNSLDRFTKASNELYAELLSGFDLLPIKELTIIPDDSLSYLPFDILLSQIPEKSNPRYFDYLIKTHNISYAYSASLFQMQQSNTNRNGKVLTIAPVFKNHPTKHLRYSDHDIKAFQNVAHISLKHQDATISNFLEKAPNFGLLYFSTHATAEDTINHQPSIEFIDEQFYLSSLYSMRLPTHLAVLSACETGIGEKESGEGVMSLARGFTYSGVPSIMTTLWKVNEKSTDPVLQDFFQNLRIGKKKNEALRLAKINFLENCDDIKVSPFYWAGFVLIGNDQPFVFEEIINWNKFFLIGMFTIVLLFYAKRIF